MTEKAQMERDYRMTVSKMENEKSMFEEKFKGLEKSCFELTKMKGE